MVERQSSEKLDITIYFWGLVCRYVDSAGIKTFKNPVLTIRYPHFTFFQI